MSRLRGDTDVPEARDRGVDDGLSDRTARRPDGDTENREAVVLHASAVALSGRGLLIAGASGSGKSTLALHLMAMGAGLLADDRTEIRAGAGQLIASAPATLPPRIEARGIGLIAVALHPAAPLIAIVDLDLPSPTRLPMPRFRDILGIRLPVLSGQVGPHLCPALIQILKSGQVPQHD